MSLLHGGDAVILITADAAVSLRISNGNLFMDRFPLFYCTDCKKLDDFTCGRQSFRFIFIRPFSLLEKLNQVLFVGLQFRVSYQ